MFRQSAKCFHGLLSPVRPESRIEAEAVAIALAQRVTKHDKNGGFMYKAVLENRGDSKYFATTRHSTFVLDTEGNGANPVDTLLASLGGCLGHYVRDYLNEHTIAHNGFAIEANAGVTEDRSRLAEISVSIDLKDVALDERHAAALLDYIKVCKVYKILTENPGVAVSLAGR
jgi:uncharacterized OsmC-like protein